MPAPHKPRSAAGVDLPATAPTVKPGPIARFLADVKSGAARKFVVGVAGLAASLLAAGLIPAPYNHYVEAVLAALTAAGIYSARNAPSTADSEAGLTLVEFIVGAFVVALLILVLAHLGAFH